MDRSAAQDSGGWEAVAAHQEHHQTGSCFLNSLMCIYLDDRKSFSDLRSKILKSNKLKKKLFLKLFFEIQCVSKIWTN